MSDESGRGPGDQEPKSASTEDARESVPAQPQIAAPSLPEHLPSFPREEPPPAPFWKTNLVGVMLILATGLMLLFMRVSAKNLVGTSDRVESVGGAEADLPYVPEAPKRKEPPPLDLAARAELLARAQKSCTGDDAAACVAAVDALEGQGEPVDPDLSAYRITSLAKIGERSRAIRLGRHFLLRYPDHAARDRVQKALTSIGTPADSAVGRPLPGRPRTKK